MPGLSVKRARRLGAGESLVAAKSAAAWCGFALSGGVADSEGSSSVRRSPSPRYVGTRGGVWPWAVIRTAFPRGRMPRMRTGGGLQTLALQASTPRKDRQDAWAFREASQAARCRRKSRRREIGRGVVWFCVVRWGGRFRRLLERSPITFTSLCGDTGRRVAVCSSPTASPRGRMPGMRTGGGLQTSALQASAPGERQAGCLGFP